MKRRQFWMMSQPQAQAANEPGFDGSITPVEAQPLDGAAEPVGGWDPHEVWRTRVKVAPHKPPSD